MTSDTVHVIAVDMDKVDNTQLHIMNRINAVFGKVSFVCFCNIQTIRDNHQTLGGGVRSQVQYLAIED